MVVRLFLVCCAALALQASAAFARGHLDTSFGKHGVVDLADKGSPSSGPGEIEVGPHGEIFLTEEEPVCNRGGCPSRVYLKRYHAEGARDRHFGGGRAFLGTTDSYGDLAIDSAGRPLIALEKGKGVVVRRFRPGGRPDRSFGNSGSSFVSCGCYLTALQVGPGNRPLLSGHSEFRQTSPFKGVIWVMARLRADGSADRSFDRDGLLRKPMPGYDDPAIIILPSGDMTLYGFSCCRFPEAPFVQRMSKSGRLRQRYGAVTKRSLHGLAGTRQEQVGWEEMALVQQAQEVELFGSEEEGAHLAVRLRSDGSRDPSFGKRGVKRLGFEVDDATADGFGRTLLAAYVYRPRARARSGYRVMRMLPDGRIDRGFGRVNLPGADNEEGVWIFPQGRAAAIVYDPGLPFCRQACEADPKMYRVVDSRR